MPVSSSDYLHSSAELIMGKFPSLSSSKRNVMMKLWFWWYLPCLPSTRGGWLDIHFLTVRSTSKHLPLLAFSFLKAGLWPHNFFLPLSTEIASLLPDMSQNLFWQSWSNCKELDWDCFLMTVKWKSYLQWYRSEQLLKVGHGF